VPFLEALDPYIGIGYGVYDGATETTFLENIDFGVHSAGQQSINWTTSINVVEKMIL
jgi:hypothetical protein